MVNGTPGIGGVTKGAHLSKSHFGEKERRKGGEEATAWEKINF